MISEAHTVDFSSARFAEKPFPHFSTAEILKPEDSIEILNWLEATTMWKLVVTDFYEQYEFSILNANLPSRLIFMQEQSFSDSLRSGAESLFRVVLKRDFDLAVHRLIPGQTIRVHNDYIPECETHRLLIQLNRGWSQENGGVLLLFNGQSDSNVAKAFAPLHNSAVGFAISTDSNHAVSTVHQGDRFTLVCSFYENRNGG